jgi:hypothetical protein
MMPLQNFSASLHVAMGLLAMWVLVFKLFRDYRIDALRDRLFSLRDDLFDYAAEGSVSFDDPAYFKLRALINSFIRFAHRLSFTRFSLGSLFTSWKWREAFGNPLLEWQDAVKKLPAEQQERLNELHSEVLLAVVKHLITGSPIMIGCLAIFAIGAVLGGLTKKLVEAFAKTLAPQLDALQIQAIVADAADRQVHHDPVMAH